MDETEITETPETKRFMERELCGANSLPKMT